MLDLIISYINFMILSVSYIVKIFAFIPPDPPKYIIENSYIKKGGKIEKKRRYSFFIKI